MPFHHRDLEPDCVGVSTKGGEWGPSAKREARDIAERRTRGGEMLPMLEVGWRASALRGEEAAPFREVAGVSIVDGHAS